ncbi:MAG: hypothetical protein NC132_05245 [Corallococcus sp.]|nr:hypothetical protein [Corallococcus sp.]MCM1359943.1 hypothetical protein [Corallococcus sp.]MCM1395499.1 hypothetical protein [Corallococcus sp.]
MKSWKKRWKDELDEITPALRDDIKNTPISTTENIDNNGGNTAVLSISKQKLIPIAAAAFALLLCAVLLCVLLIKPNNSYRDFLFTLEINPAVTMSADEDGIVTGVIASNADADIILSDESVRNQIKGKSIDEAVTYYTDYAAKLGYIDLEQKGSAVRISGLGDEDFLGKAQTALETYFTDKGLFVVVIAENVNNDEFCLRSGITAENAAKFIKDSTVLFSDRTAENLSLQDLQSLYNKLVVENKLFDYVTESLSGNIERIIKNAEDIQNLSQLYFTILNHADNPIKMLGDYWTVKKLYGNTLSGEFAKLMSEMETALENYKADYGVEITGVTQLTDAANSYLKIPASNIATLLESFSFDKFKELSSDITEILEITGLITSDFANYLQAPQSLAEYVEKTSALIKSEYKSRLETYENLYNKYRPPIEKTDYDSFIESTVQQYGSLNAYWQAIKN